MGELLGDIRAAFALNSFLRCLMWGNPAFLEVDETKQCPKINYAGAGRLS
ncbi:hypothetical protein AB0K60_19210 [Thermopolyspora sp. NPDC052614]